jgi:hypothetical protein
MLIENVRGLLPLKCLALTVALSASFFPEKVAWIQEQNRAGGKMIRRRTQEVFIQFF